MLTMFVVLRDEEQTRTVVSTMIECGIFEATILDGEGVEHYAAETIPVFSSLGSLFGDRSTYNNTIIAAVENRETVVEFVSLCAKTGIDFSQPGVGSVMAVACEFFAGERGPRP
ncbi:MAG: hypothetical protein EA403_14070 [Spirochaetaceae bacterium]|nr:MAG: hypothetical protein EA403_14070 [Spirochaetaceae bacterium]